MAPAAPVIPTRFPCWVRAVYSWGGESKHDLGFIEGDLIECLNAGDGSWWTGRLRRDRRMVGSFPSNFVEVLPDDFSPQKRSTSPLVAAPSLAASDIRKKKTFRKPFEAYAKAPHYTTAKQPVTYKNGIKPESPPPEPARQNSKHSFIGEGGGSGSGSGSVRSNGSSRGRSQTDAMDARQRQDSFRAQQRPKSFHQDYANGSLRQNRSGFGQTLLQSSMQNRRSYHPDFAPATTASPSQGQRRAPSPNPMMDRVPSPQPMGYRAHSPNPYSQPLSSSYQTPPHEAGVSRAHSPNPSMLHRSHSPSPMAVMDSHYTPDSRGMVPPRSYSPNPMAMAMSRSHPHHSQSYAGHASSPGKFDRSPSPAPMMALARTQTEPLIMDRAYSPNPAILDRSHSPNPMMAAAYGRAPSPNPMMPGPGGYGRVASPNPMMSGGYGRTPSPNPMMPGPEGYGRSASPNPMTGRAPSPLPGRAPSPSLYGALVPYGQRASSPMVPRQPSPQPMFDAPGSRDASPGFRPYRPGAETGESGDKAESPPPPPPPPHRHVKPRQPLTIDTFHQQAQHQNAGATPTYDNRSLNSNKNGGFLTPRAVSPNPNSPNEGLTPSPLREAMDDVYKELDALGMNGNEIEETPRAKSPTNAWSPQCFDLIRHEPQRKTVRPMTSMGFATGDVASRGGQTNEASNLPQLESYVERMESQFSSIHQHSSKSRHDDSQMPLSNDNTSAVTHDIPPRPQSSMSITDPGNLSKLRFRKSAYDLLARTLTTKTSSTEGSSATHSTATTSTGRSLMSGTSAGGFSATSAGSYARKNVRVRSTLALGEPVDNAEARPETPLSGVTYHSSHASQNSEAARVQAHAQSPVKPQTPVDSQTAAPAFVEDPMSGVGGGLVQPQKKKRGLFGKIRDMAKTGVASGRNSIVTAVPAKSSSTPALMSSMSLNKSLPSLLGNTPIRNGGFGSVTPKNLPSATPGGGGGVDWVQVRRDINRSNSLSRNERMDRRERCQMLDYPAINPVDEFFDTVEGDEGADGKPVHNPTNYQVINLAQADKNSRFVNGLPPMTTVATLAMQYICRPFRSDVQKLRAIFTWVAEKLTWEEDYEGDIDTRRVVETKRGCAQEYATLVAEMCAAVGLRCNVVRGYLKTPGEIPEMGVRPRPNHWWNCVVVGNEWRIIDCCLASPSNPKRSVYSSAANSVADPWWFLARPTEVCWTHIPESDQNQHIYPQVPPEVLLNLPCACPPYFKNNVDMVDYNTSLIRIEDLEMVHIQFTVPADVEVAAEVEVRGFSRDADGDYFESGEIIKKRALAQADWVNGVKRYTVKALLPGDEGTGTLKVYAGKRGLMHSIKDIPHPLAFALPVVHTGDNPPYEFVTRHPTPHAARHDIYVVQPQCRRLALNNTFVFAVRQHPSSLTGSSGGGLAPALDSLDAADGAPFVRPASALSMTASSVSGLSTTSNNNSNNGAASSPYPGGQKKPAKLAIQTPGGKILRLMRKDDPNKRPGVGMVVVGGGGRADDAVSSVTADSGSTWETIIKCGERGVWRGLVLADRVARWCVFAEWECV